MPKGRLKDASTEPAVHWKKWAAKQEQEELKEAAWIDPAPVLLRKQAKGVFGEKYRNVARKVFFGWRLDAKEAFRY